MAWKFFRRIHSFFVCEWPNERAAEIVAYAHGAVGLTVSAGLVIWAGATVPWALAGGACTFLVLMAFVFRPLTVWLAALLGSSVAAAAFGSFRWFVGHGLRTAHGPLFGAIAGGFLGAAIAVPAYVSFIKGSRMERISFVPTSH